MGANPVLSNTEIKADWMVFVVVIVLLFRRGKSTICQPNFQRNSRLLFSIFCQSVQPPFHQSAQPPFLSIRPTPSFVNPQEDAVEIGFSCKARQKTHLFFITFIPHFVNPLNPFFVNPQEDAVEIGHERKRTGEAFSCKAGQKTPKNCNIFPISTTNYNIYFHKTKNAALPTITQRKFQFCNECVAKQ